MYASLVYDQFKITYSLNVRDIKWIENTDKYIYTVNLQ